MEKFMNKPISFEIGRTCFGLSVKIPLEQEREKLWLFVEGFSVAEQVDIFCMTEFLCQRSTVRNKGGFEAQVTATVFEIGLQKFKEGLFHERLIELKLPTSTTRVSYGKSLCHIVYRD